MVFGGDPPKRELGKVALARELIERIAPGLVCLHGIRFHAKLLQNVNLHIGPFAL